jgi:hypothetical protein
MPFFEKILLYYLLRSEPVIAAAGRKGEVGAQK